MYNWKCFVFMFLIVCALQAQVLNETFDGNSNFTTSTPFFSNGDRVYFGITGDSNDFGSDPVPTGLKPYEGFSGNYLTGMRLNGMGASLPISIIWEDLDIQGATNLIFKGDFAEYFDAPGHIDASDFILVEYQIDGQGYEPLLSFVGADFINPPNNGVFREDTNFDGVGDGTALNNHAQRFTKNITETGNSLDLRISVSVNAYDEDFALGNIIITGDGVEDTTPPIITCNEDIEVFTDIDSCGAIIEFPLPEAIDETDENPIITQIEGPESGSFFETGITELVFEAEDSAGNKTQCSIEVHVFDGQAPQVQCAESIVVTADEGTCNTVVHYDLPTVSDNCSSEEEIEIELISGLGSGSSFSVGTHYETFLITDAAGNMSTCSVLIEVMPEAVPQLECPTEPIVVQVNNAGEYILPNLEGRFGITFSDYCGQRGVYTTQHPTPSTVLTVGLHDVEINLMVDGEEVDSCMVQISVQETLGIEDNTMIDFELYPNPTSDILHIHSQEEILNIKVYSMQGKLLKEFKDAPISVGDLPQGVYLLWIETIDNKGFTKVVKK